MCGTAAMSAAFADCGLRVVASDELKFPTLHAKARLLGSGEVGNISGEVRSYRQALELLNALEPTRGFFWREYGADGAPQNGGKPRRYFTGRNAGHIDAVRAKIREWRESGLPPPFCDLLLHDLILAANQVANIAGTYGYFRSTWNKASLAPLRLEPTPGPRSSLKHEVLHGSIMDLAPRIEADAFYLDPPYTKRQYGGNYHILETIAVEDEPEPVGAGGLRNWYPQASDFCYRRRARAAFDGALRRMSAPWVFLSYSEDAHIPPDEMLELLSDFGNVSRHSIKLDRFRSNGRVAKRGGVEEHLYVLEMRHDCTAKDDRIVVAEDQGE